MNCIDLPKLRGYIYRSEPKKVRKRSGKFFNVKNSTKIVLKVLYDSIIIYSHVCARCTLYMLHSIHLVLHFALNLNFLPSWLALFIQSKSIQLSVRCMWIVSKLLQNIRVSFWFLFRFGFIQIETVAVVRIWSLLFSAP